MIGEGSRYGWLRSERGFTLVELMVTVAVIGVLAAVSIPNYTQFRYRTMHTQAKIGLSDLYTNEIAFMGENGSFTTRLDALGYRPTGNTYFDIGFKTDVKSAFGPPGTAGCNSICGSAAACGAAFPGLVCLPPALNGLDGNVLAAKSTATPSTFFAEAHTHFDNDTNKPASWTIDESRNLNPVDPAN